MIFNPHDLERILAEAPERTGQTIKQAAGRSGFATPNHLARQLNPDDPGAKLGIVDFVYFCAATDLAALDYIEAAFGRVATPMPCAQGAGKDPEREATDVLLAGAPLVELVRDAVADNRITPKELMQVERAAQRVQAELAEAIEAVRRRAAQYGEAKLAVADR